MGDNYNSGLFVGADGHVYDVTNGMNDTGLTADISRYTYNSGLFLNEDGEVVDITKLIGGGGGGTIPHMSLERLRSYLFKIAFAEIPEYKGGGFMPTACSSCVSGGKLYRNLDWLYDETPSFFVKCKGFCGMAFDNRLTDTHLDNAVIAQLPYRMVDGVNENGIMMSVHVLFNDWEWTGTGETPLMKLGYLILTNVKSMATIDTDLADIISDLYADESMGEYLLQFVITDGTTTYVLTPPTSADGSYSLVDITENPKLTNFRWVNHKSVEHDADYMQDRPTGIERWNDMSTDLEDLRFTACYEQPDRLSEFIGINETTKDSTDEELMAIYDLAHAAYLTRTRDGTLWHTMHSVVYSPTGIEELYVQEDWGRSYADGGKGQYDIDTERAIEELLEGYADISDSE